VPSTIALQFEQITKRFPAKGSTLSKSLKGPADGAYTAVAGIDLDVRAGAFVSVVGPSGCGKSTVLNIAAGLMQPTEGVVKVFGERLDSAGVNRRAAYLFQQDALLPWKTVLSNIALALIFRGVDRGQAEKRALEWVGRIGLDGFADSYPAQLSGGMRKRVAMAQSWIADPDILLMDEPFSALDVHTRLRMEGELLTLWSSSPSPSPSTPSDMSPASPFTSPKTVLFVTHDLEEALALSDEVVVLSAGPASHIVNRYTVDLPRPRDLIDIRTEPRFQELYRGIWAELKQEVLTSYARGN
jgi:NitT/TauT family transport system ATP-binding protein